LEFNPSNSAKSELRTIKISKGEKMKLDWKMILASAVAGAVLVAVLKNTPVVKDYAGKYL